ncbi:hypothetical protein POM88_031431 [Heracleum sosnowskyi]|uniref:C2H2-type domain-containing protein n=1 Tax=Heracleum sosnowskyi TaxID=360622 RepID=A0AAD8HZH4_9APIA|nr:hypothetical protein POM88_031431 [Heracleum sosnowskyi]
MDRNQLNCFNSGPPVVATTLTQSPPPPSAAERRRRRQQITGNDTQNISLINDDDVEVIALSVEEIYAKPLFSCELCNKGFTREQNLIIHRRAHYIPYVRNNRPVQNNDDEKRKVYVCPEITCFYHNSANALCDIASLRKHYKRKHGEKTMSCTKCEKTYALEGDLRAHLKICGTREYVCVCGSVFSRRDSFLAHKLPCDNIALANQLYMLQNEFQSNQTTVGRVPSIPYPNNLQPALNSNAITSAHSFPFLSNTILVPPVSDLSSLNQSVSWNTTINFANNRSTQENDNIFDVNVLHESLFGVSSVPATALPQEAPQQGYSLANSGMLSSILQSSENSAAAGFDESSLDVYPNVSGAYENPDQLTGGYSQTGDYWNTPVPVLSENSFGTILDDRTTQNSGPSGFGVDDQFNQLVQFPGNTVCGDANFQVLQNNFHFWENRRN